MIDWIKITLRDFTGSLDYCQQGDVGVDKETGLIYENYHLPNGYREPKQHWMHVARQAGSNKISVEGSIRKWGNHRNTLADLTAKTFERALHKLARRLNVPFEELCRAGFTQCEIGLNVKTAIPGYQITPMVVKYGRLKNRREAGDKSKTIYFEGTAKMLKLYDKVIEIADKAGGGTENAAMMRRISDRLLEDHQNYLRIEYTLFHQKGFGQHGLGHIKTIGDLIAHYSDLYEFWCRETHDIVLFNDNATPPNREKLNKSELRIIDNLDIYGFEGAVEREASGINEDAPTASQMLSRAQKKILTVIGKYYRDGYCTQTLRLDASRHLWRQRSRFKVDIPLNACLRALWAVEPGKSGSH